LKKIFVVSAVNIIDGGALTILSAFIKAAQSPRFHDWQFIALVNPLVKLDFGRIKKINFSAPKKSWVVRLYYEYVVFRKISKRLQVDVWLSLHDITPNVVAKKRFVYCHNPAPFYSLTWRDALLDPRFVIFKKLYKLFYKVNINRNDAVIVQQNWLKKIFSTFVKIPIHVSHPEYVLSLESKLRVNKHSKVRFIYPAFPRVFKNHSIVGDALRLLSSSERQDIEIVFTVQGSENKYAEWLKNRYHHLSEIDFMGRLSYEETQKLYQSADCLIFPSKLETWGLPLTEAKYFQKDIICADLPYARETLGGYVKVLYVSPEKPDEWADAIRKYSKSRSISEDDHMLMKFDNPDSVGFTQLLNYLTRMDPA